MTPVNLPRVSPVLTLAVCAASFLTVTACGSPTNTSSSKSPTTSSISDLYTRPSAPATPTVAGACPTVAPQNGGTPEWTLAGTTGSVAVTGSTDATAPRVAVTAPFSVAQTQVHTLRAGDGPVVSNTARVSVCYMGVNGRDGSVFDTTYERGAPVDFPLTGVVPGFQKAIAGQKVGSTVAVAMTSADGYPDGQPSAGIRPGDTLIFAIKILSASS